MGGLAALLLMTTVGLNYGWRPDDQGGVEYLIQIPPDQLDEMHRLGAVTSVIDPAVKGRVSKVIISVGNETLPRELPADLATIDAPESMERVLKPQSPSQGLSLPNLPASLGAQTPGAGAPPVGSTFRGAAPPGVAASTAPASSFTPPGFGSAAAGSATSRPGTGMSANLANQIQEELGATANQIKAAGESAFASGVDAVNRAGSDAISRAGNGLRDSINGALGQQGALGGQQPAAPRTPSLQFTTGDPNFARSRAGGPTTDPVTRDNSWNGLSNRRPSATSQANPATLGSPSLSGPSFGATSNPANNGTLGSFGQLPGGMTLPNTGSAANTNAPNNRSFGAEVENPFDNRPSNPVLTSNNPSASGSSSAGTTYPPGTVALDAYGRPVNEMGQLIDRYGRVIAAVASSNPDTRASNDTQFAPRQSAPPSYPRTPEPASSSNLDQFRSDRRGSFSPQGQVAPIERPSNPPPTVARSPNSNSTSASRSRELASSQDDVEPTRTNQSIAAQPLFNGLLLISLVVNVYLINWLQKLRNRFRELVTAKRSGNAAPSN